MKVLIDGIESKIEYGYQLENNVTKDKRRNVRVAFHTGLQFHEKTRNTNSKLITNGRVYILHYDEKTFNPTPPMTYKEYENLKK